MEGLQNKAVKLLIPIAESCHRGWNLGLGPSSPEPASCLGLRIVLAPTFSSWTEAWARPPAKVPQVSWGENTLSLPWLWSSSRLNQRNVARSHRSRVTLVPSSTPSIPHLAGRPVTFLDRPSVPAPGKSGYWCGMSEFSRNVGNYVSPPHQR